MSFNECSNILSSMSFNGNTQKNFFDYVYYKIAQNTQNRFVEKNSDSIDIILDSHPCIKVIPICQNMDKDELIIDKQMKQATTIIKSGEFKYVYFVYPKNDNFNKHIQIKIPEFENACSDYMVKLIPYSLGRIQKKGKCDEHCNILCK